VSDLRLSPAEAALYGTPEARQRDHEAYQRRLAGITSYADAFAAAIRRAGVFEVEGLRFARRADVSVPTDYVASGRHTLVFELLGTGKTYRLMIEPVPETHR